MAKVLETTLDDLVEAARQAGFKPGRRLRVVVSYAGEGREQTAKWLNDLLARYPLPPPDDTMTEEEALELANEAIREYRAEQQGR